MSDTPAVVTHNETAHRFEVRLDHQVALSSYRRQPGTITFLHTEVPAEMGGRGIAAQLASAGLEFARVQGLAVIPLCPYIARYLSKHPEYLDLVHDDHRARIAGGE